MRNKNVHYYLMNGENRTSNALYLLVDGKLVKSFPDISDLDLQTMNISSKDKTDILSEYNKGLNLGDKFYDVSFPFKKTEVKTFAPIFNYMDEAMKNQMNYYYDNLRYFAEQRSYYNANGQKLKLDINSALRSYYRSLLRSVIINNIPNFTDVSCICSTKIKSMVKERNTGIDDFLDRNSVVLSDIMSNYTELRRLTITYLLYLSNRNIKVRGYLKDKETWNNKGMVYTPPIEYKKDMEIPQDIETRQMHIFDYIDNPEKIYTIKNNNINNRRNN